MGLRSFLLDDVRPVRTMHEHIPHEYRQPEIFDDRFVARTGKTIFLAAGLTLPKGRHSLERLQGVDYIESFDLRRDRRVKADVVLAERAAHEEAGNKDTAAYYERMLQLVYEEPSLVVLHILSACVPVYYNNGFPFMVYGTVSDAKVIEQIRQ